MPRNTPDIRAPIGTTQRIASYIGSVVQQDLPEEVAIKTKCHPIDSLTVIVSGSKLKAGKLATGFIATQGGTPEGKPARQAIVEIETKDGRNYRHRTVAVRGTPSNPMPPGDVKAKAHDSIVPILGEATSANLIDAVWRLEALADSDALSAIAKGECE